jgi:adenine phosphoribosyltransferase
MKILKNVLKSNLALRTQNDFPVEGVEFIDITPLILQKETFNEITEKFCKEISDKRIDYLVLPEARGFLFGSAVAEKLNIGIIPVRKKGKLPPDFVESTVEYTKEYGKGVFELPKLVNEEYKDKRFYIVDDIYATGNTMKAIIKEIESLSGEVVGVGVVVNIPALNNDNNVFSLIDIEETNE